MNNDRRLGYVVFAAVALVSAGASPRARAGAVYRCIAAGGQTAITNKPSEYSACVKVPGTDYPDPKPARPAPVPAPAPKAPITASTPIETKSSRGEYHSAPPPTFANVISGATINGVVQFNNVIGGVMQPRNATERPDKNVEVRRGAVYKVARANGITEYTNVRPAGAPFQLLFTYIQTCFACNLNSTVDFASTALNLDAYRDEIAAASGEFGVDQALLRAVIHAESAFNPNAISAKGAQGLMQLMPTTANDLGVGNPFEVGQNIRGGAHYLAQLLKQFNGDERLAAAAYNSGPQNVQKYAGVPPFDETKVYVDRVATLRKRYSEAK
jgi:hypothetical protein